mmetsp:Transcript_45393/g.33176  ORF Transcript_45393/g.33176 Transcript_45393/m.33176 type:complete len:312 (+) Transcript_45393:2391-3326(+)
MTLIRMLLDCLAFIFVFLCYLMLASTIFTILFQSVEEESYGSLSLSCQTLFTSFIGNYDYIEADGYFISGSVAIVIHEFFSNIFLLNFLVAILSSVYEIMLNEGEFEYKKCKYEFIEKYSVAMLDQNGYSELVVHPAPLNAFTFFILPFAVKPSFMKKAAAVFSKFIFWFENSLFIFLFFLYELVLCPLIYLRVVYNVAKLSTFLSFLPLELFWLLIGPFYLVYVIFRDIFYLVKILCDYQQEEDNLKEKEEEDFKQDKIVIYNEVIDVMRSIMHLFLKRRQEQKSFKKQEVNLFDQAQEEEEEDKYTISM